ncbi:tol-pal system protein YbgF [Legionella israelensis]|uniref:Cell division coordinator CpoB n=1 Tax=Legionella israelensis TaxID=454 RepID=A0AAX1EEW1_9GAMM|nr:tol-pal system protein YbgF [Legionella israelensis]QBR83587.1 tol-pal system protein YbgF [Legionella israelensis]
MNGGKKIIAVLFFVLLPMSVWAEVPVIDESDNFAVMEEQSDMDAPLAKAQLDEVEDNEENALAMDDALPSTSTLPTASDNAKLLEKIQQLQQEIQELRGQLEVQAHDLKLLQQQQVAFYKDLDARLSVNGHSSVNEKSPSDEMTIESSRKVHETKPELTKKTARLVNHNGSRVNPADEQISYLAAYDLVKQKRFDEAIKAMENFVRQYPQGGYAANAQYWLGELYLVKNDYSQAIAHFDTVINQYPSSSKSAASLLKMGYALAASGKTDEAKQRLHEVVKNYPDTSTARLARSKLEMLDGL